MKRQTSLGHLEMWTSGTVGVPEYDSWGQFLLEKSMQNPRKLMVDQHFPEWICHFLPFFVRILHFQTSGNLWCYKQQCVNSESSLW